MQTSNFPTQAEMTDAQLVAKFQLTRNNQLFAELYNRYFNKVRIYCLKSLSDTAAAEDVAQEVMLKAFEKLPTLQNAQLWVAWLFSIARNEVLNTHKRNARSRMEPVETCFALADEPADLESMREKDQKLAALPVLLETPAARILKLKYVEGRSIEQLSKQLNMNESAVKMRLLRARQKVVHVYEQQYARA